MTAVRMRAVALAALLCGVAVVALLAASDHQGSKAVWAIFGPVIGWNFIGVGLYALANVAKYAQATEATVAVHRANGCVTVEVSDDGIGGADADQGSGLRGLGDRVAALDSTLSLDSPPGRGTRLHVEIPCEPRAGPA
jgi:signal transduction histidine kinase